MDKDLVLTPREGESFALSTFRGRITVAAFLSKAACHTGLALELVDQVLLEIGPSNLMSVGCIVDLEHQEKLREYAPFLIPIGAAPRRQVADFLNVPMSGFSLPQFLLLDRTGKQRFLLSVPRGDDFWEMGKSLRQLVDLLLAEKSLASEAVA